jgi:deoxyribodipyrimidine photo-lyase
MKKEISVCWFRRDLRLNDNHAFFQALSGKYEVLPIFIFDPEILEKLSNKSDKRVAFIHQSLLKMNTVLNENGASIHVFHDKVEHVFEKLNAQYDVKEVYANHDYEPYAINRDSKISNLLASHNIPLKTFKDQVIFEKSEVIKADGTPYTIFTPFSRKWKEKFQQTTLTHYHSEKILSKVLKVLNHPFPSLVDIGFENVNVDFSDFNITEDLIKNYEETRNLPSVEGTTQISVHLRFGTLSIRDLVKLGINWNEKWLNELIWREFFMMILYHFPHVIDESFKKKYDKIQWRNNEAEFEKWCKGQTGYPIVDAGMRQLNETGFMHNRVRMITAGFLCKHLLIDWRWGEAYFAQKLIDYELSSNNGNWQWAAGSGCDSAPYFRIFNPTAQTLKFDPKLKYIKTWIKDFKVDYLHPIVEHEFGRKRALEVYKMAVNE